MRQEVANSRMPHNHPVRGCVSRLASLLMACLLVANSGCSSWDFTSKLPWTDPEAKVKKSKFDKPTRLVAIWTPTTLTAPGKPVTRGFGGRLYFYNDVGTAVPVEGQLLVYAYDDTNNKQERGVRGSTGGLDEPDRKYAFTAEQFSTHYSPTDLGASYSIWIPWGPNDGPQTEVSLVPVFTASTGNIVMGQSSRHVLKGTRPQGEESAMKLSRLPAAAEPQEDLVQTQQTVKQTELRSTTITLPEHTAERLSRLGPTPSYVAPMPASASPSASAPIQGPAGVAQPVVAPASYQMEVSNVPAATGAAAATPQHWSDAMKRPDYFARPKFPAPTLPSQPPAPGPAPTPPSPTGWPSSPPSLPPPNPTAPAPANSAAAMQTGGSHW